MSKPFNNRLPSDICRCVNDECKQKHDCLRWLWRNDNIGQATPSGILQEGDGWGCPFFFPKDSTISQP